MTVDTWQWLAILALFVLQMIYVSLTHQCFTAVIGCVRAIREVLQGKRSDDISDEGKR